MEHIKFKLLHGIIYHNHREFIRRGNVFIILRLFELSENFRFDTHIEIAYNDGNRVVEVGDAFVRNSNTRNDLIGFCNMILSSYETGGVNLSNVNNVDAFLKITLSSFLVMTDINHNN